MIFWLIIYAIISYLELWQGLVQSVVDGCAVVNTVINVQQIL